MRAVSTVTREATKGEKTRKRIIEVAAPLFNQRGFAGCSVQDVMEAAGLGKGGIYRHFESKEELAAAAFEYGYGETIKQRRIGLDEIESAIGKLRHMVKHFVDIPSAVPGGCPLMNTAIDADDGNPALRKLAEQGLRTWKNRITSIVRQGVRSREIAATARPEQIANTIIATLEGSLMICRLEGNRNALQHAKTALDRMLMALSSHPRARVRHL